MQINILLKKAFQTYSFILTLMLITLLQRVLIWFVWSILTSFMDIIWEEARPPLAQTDLNEDALTQIHGKVLLGSMTNFEDCWGNSIMTAFYVFHFPFLLCNDFASEVQTSAMFNSLLFNRSIAFNHSWPCSLTSCISQVKGLALTLFKACRNQHIT